MRAIGEEKDELVDRLAWSIGLRFPSHAPSDALQSISADRKIDRCAGESDAAFRVRLLRAWETWLWSGTAYGILQAFEALGWAITHLDPGGWPALWPTNEAGEHGHVWSVKSNAWDGSPPPGGTETWSDFWIMLDLHGHETTLRWTGWAIGGKVGASPGTTSAIFAEVRSAGTLVREGGPDTPTARSQSAACTWRDCIVLFGGVDGSSTLLSDTYIWWEHADCWTKANPAASPSARYGHCMAEFNGEVYLFGGTEASGVSADVYKFDGGEWSLHSALESRTGSAMAVLGELLYMWGGLGGNAYGYVFDGSGWDSTAADYPEVVSGLSLISMGDHLLGFGGYDGVSDYTNALYMFDGTHWSVLDNGSGTAPTGRHLHGAARISDTEMIVWGGLSAGGAHYDVWRWDGAWHRETDLPTPWFAGAQLGTAFKSTCPRWDDGWAWDDGTTWSTSLRENDIEAIRASIEKWKGAHGTCVELVVQIDAGGWSGIWGESFWNWDDGSVWGAAETVRIPVAGA